ncbi:DUF998 domain-containing protein [Glycomyces sp. TRM65418]|uniref:DUF998 domain-containing protein n=1 Tax=Glycomyces sp. TRM65418 TaxID=2867006 RepID=UPI001CE53CBD|nr:DUF998 domain-containing protein [Glycomyces sp. TRM65418]MCC3761609.1 DUF998 domain-containing protein [Glycomyces sp. TRM65418]QZD55705.1 DUF998 domain-containing protein [Glycomyces sp. TRM65418]
MTATAAHHIEVHRTAADGEGHSAGTRRMLASLIAGTAVFGVVSLTQAVTREGFDLTRHPLSLLSNGDLGWIQITNFIVSGLLLTLGGVGLRRALRGTPGGAWGPRLVLAYGIGILLCGPFVLQGGGGFPADASEASGMTLGSVLHLAVGTIAFIALIAACYVMGRHYARTGRRGMALSSRIAATVFLAGDLYSSAQGPAGSLVLAFTCLTAMTWLAIVAADARRG